MLARGTPAPGASLLLLHEGELVEQQALGTDQILDLPLLGPPGSGFRHTGTHLFVAAAVAEVVTDSPDRAAGSGTDAVQTSGQFVVVGTARAVGGQVPSRLER